MTRTHVRLIATLSLIATALVLVDGAGTPRARSAAAVVAAAQPVVVHAPLPATPTASPTPAVTAPPASTDGGAANRPAPGATPSPASGSGGGPSTPARPRGSAATASKVEHVFVIALTATAGDPAFAARSAAPYLATELRPRGTLLSGFRPLDASDLPNYLAMTAGQPPNPDTRGECATFSDFPSDAASGGDGAVPGAGCVYPNTVMSIGDQLTSAGRSWRAYAEDMDRGPGGAQPCRHPRPGEPDDTLRARAGDGYATRHNPFVYFHSLLDLGDCLANDVPLKRLSEDLKRTSSTPSYAFVAPNLCNGGTESPCVDARPGGLAAADAFLHEWVPRILRAPAFKRDGVLVVAFLSSTPPRAGAAPAPTPTPDASTGASPAPTGALVISRFARAGAEIAKPFDPYSLLRSVEDVFALKPLARAKRAASFATSALPRAFGG